MYKYDNVWNDINNLVALCNQLNFKQALHEYYGRYGNTAPEQMFEEYLTKVKEHLDNSLISEE